VEQVDKVSLEERGAHRVAALKMAIAMLKDAAPAK